MATPKITKGIDGVTDTLEEAVIVATLAKAFEKGDLEPIKMHDLRDAIKVGSYDRLYSVLDGLVEKGILPEQSEPWGRIDGLVIPGITFEIEAQLSFKPTKSGQARMDFEGAPDEVDHDKFIIPAPTRERRLWDRVEMGSTIYRIELTEERQEEPSSGLLAVHFVITAKDLGNEDEAIEKEKGTRESVTACFEYWDQWVADYAPGAERPVTEEARICEWALALVPTPDKSIELSEAAYSVVLAAFRTEGYDPEPGAPDENENPFFDVYVDMGEEADPLEYCFELVKEGGGTVPANWPGGPEELQFPPVITWIEAIYNDRPVDGDAPYTIWVDRDTFVTAHAEALDCKAFRRPQYSWGIGNPDVTPMQLMEFGGDVPLATITWGENGYRWPGLDIQVERSPKDPTELLIEWAEALPVVGDDVAYLSRQAFDLLEKAYAANSIDYRTFEKDGSDWLQAEGEGAQGHYNFAVAEDGHAAPDFTTTPVDVEEVNPVGEGSLEAQLLLDGPREVRAVATPAGNGFYDVLFTGPLCESGEHTKRVKVSTFKGDFPTWAKSHAEKTLKNFLKGSS